MILVAPAAVNFLDGYPDPIDLSRMFPIEMIHILAELARAYYRLRRADIPGFVDIVEDLRLTVFDVIVCFYSRGLNTGCTLSINQIETLMGVIFTPDYNDERFFVREIREPYTSVSINSEMFYTRTSFRKDHS
jgi:hypothetical protein